MKTQSNGGYSLLPGFETETRIRALAELANLESENKIDSLVEYFTKGTSQSTLAIVYDIDQAAISRAAAQLQKRYKQACKVVEAR